MIAIGIITAPRTRPTLDASLTSLVNAGFHEAALISQDGGARSERRETMVHNSPALGNLRNWANTLRTLLSVTAPLNHVRHLMVCEDDITWAAASHDILMADLETTLLGKGDVGCRSLYTPNKVLNYLRSHGKDPTDATYHGVNMGAHTWGAQCLVFTKEQANALLMSAYFLGKLANPSLHKNVDRFIAEAFETMGRKIYYRVPCLVHHELGDNNSSLGYGDRPSLRSDCFIGKW